LRVHADGADKDISQSRASRFFSWSQQGSLVYSDSTSADGGTDKSAQPHIYENDLKGGIKKIKDGGSHPLLSPNRKFLASLVPYPSPAINTNGSGGAGRRSGQAVRTGLAVYDMQRKVDVVVGQIYDQEARLFWSQDGTKIYVAENYYVLGKRTAYCRVSFYDTTTRKYPVLCRISQPGESSSPGDQQLQPYFTMIGVANGEHLIFQVPLKASGDHNQSIISLDLITGKRVDLLSFTAAPSDYQIPMVDWIDAVHHP
jgi:hypothetical protein